ncbi:hypothetical protein ACOMHN_049920 [Nucella lapillus]
MLCSSPVAMGFLGLKWTTDEALSGQCSSSTVLGLKWTTDEALSGQCSSSAVRVSKSSTRTMGRMGSMDTFCRLPIPACRSWVRLSSRHPFRDSWSAPSGCRSSLKS